MRNFFTNYGRLRLNFEQKMLLRQFKIRVFITIWILSFASFALYNDTPLGRKYGIWLTNLITFIIGWWLPSPGTPPPTITQQVSTEKALIVQDNDPQELR